MTPVNEGHLDFFIRAGWMHYLLDARDDDHRGWVLQLSILGGYRLFFRAEGGQDDTMFWERNHCGQLLVGLGATHWFSSRIGIDFQLRGGASLPFSQKQIGWTGEWGADEKPTTVIGDVSLTMGLAARPVGGFLSTSSIIGMPFSLPISRRAWA